MKYLVKVYDFDPSIAGEGSKRFMLQRLFTDTEDMAKSLVEYTRCGYLFTVQFSE